MARSNRRKQVYAARKDSRGGRELAYKKRILSRKAKKQDMMIITRRDQPQYLRGKTESYRTKQGEVVFYQVTEMEALKKQDIPLTSVSSSWIAALAYNKGLKEGIMHLGNGYVYAIEDLPFKVFEQWYNAHSKGTFFNHMIKDKYKVVRKL